MFTPLVSIIVVCRNPGPKLHAALGSVWNQQNEGCEMIVVDGASTDGTRTWLEPQRTRLGTLISEPDLGIYDAMNKGIAAARGKWVLFLGADDRLQEGALAGIAAALQQTRADVVVGEAAFDDGRIYRLGETTSAVRRNFVHHQASFYQRTLFGAHGSFLTDLRIMADYEFNVRIMKAGVRFQSMPARVAVCGSGGLSDAGGWTGYREEIIVRHRHFPAWQCWLWDVSSVLRFLRKKFLRTFSPHG